MVVQNAVLQTSRSTLQVGPRSSSISVRKTLPFARIPLPPHSKHHSDRRPLRWIVASAASEESGGPAATDAAEEIPRKPPFDPPQLTFC